MLTKRFGKDEDELKGGRVPRRRQAEIEQELIHETAAVPEAQANPSSAGDIIDAPKVVVDDVDGDIDDLKKRCLEAVPKDSTRIHRVEKGLQRLKRDAKLKDMTAILEEDVYFRRNRSRVYCYLVPLLSLFYFIPSIQFVFLVKESENMTGSQDLCFHNFECSNHFFIFSDFNHVISNVSYIIFGIGFTLLVLLKSKRLPEDQHPKSDHLAGRGILQQLSIFYAMGFALASQGLFSVCYHVCPTNHSLQFDTTMMYVMCMLGIVKIYQFRHPDANANAYSFFYFLGGIVLLEALALYSYSWWVYGIFIFMYVMMTIFIAIDCYFMGVGRLDGEIAKVLAKEIVTGWKENPTNIKYKKRFLFTCIFCGINMSLALYFTIAKIRNPFKTVTHVVLVILAMNLFIYIAYYVFRKNKQRYDSFCKQRRMCRSTSNGTTGGNPTSTPASPTGSEPQDGAKSPTGSDELDAKYYIPIRGQKIPVLISAGSLFAIAAIFLGGFASYFYLNRSANRNLSPAASRNLNEPCGYMGFYDNHDMWHFFSSSAIFFAFLALLTVDDDFLTESRDSIEVF